MCNPCRKLLRRRNRPRKRQTPREWRRCLVCGEPFLRMQRQLYCAWTCERMAADMMGGKGSGILRWQLASPAEREAMLDRLVEIEQSPWHELRVTRYGSAHAAERRRRLDERGPDERCARCRLPLPAVEAEIDLDHDDDDPTRYLGLSCQPCNRGKRPVVAELLAS